MQRADLATLIAQESTIIDIVDPYLTLNGLQLIYKRNMDNIRKITARKELYNELII